MVASRSRTARERREEAARRLGRRYDDLSPSALVAGEDWSDDSLDGRLFLDTYSEEGLRRVFSHYGVDRLLARRGIERFSVEVDTSDPWLHELRLREAGTGTPFVDLRVRIAVCGDLGIGGRLAPLTCLVVEWLSLEHPQERFDPMHPPLPGQRRPGLGIGPEVEELLVLAARRVGAAALVSWPQWLHNAWLYHPRWRFVDPGEDGRFAALIRDLQDYGLVKVAWGVHLGCVRDHRGRTWEWRPGPLLLPRTREAARHFSTPHHRATRLAARVRSGFILDEEALQVQLAQRGLVLP